MAESPKAPAAAYFEMAPMLGEPYFATPPPLVGMVLRVVGVDGIETEWSMSEAQGRIVADKVRDCSQLRLVSHRRYANQGR